MKLYYVYILKCSDCSYYTGITNEINRRLEEHHSGLNKCCYTSKRLPLELVHLEEFIDVNQAIDREKQIKKWSKKKKDALSKKNYEELKILCKNYRDSKG